MAEPAIRDSVTSIIQRDGSLLVATHEALFRVEGERATRIAGHERFGSDSIATVLEDRHGTVWVATHRAVWRWRDSVTRVMSVDSMRSPS